MPLPRCRWMKAGEGSRLLRGLAVWLAILVSQVPLNVHADVALPGVFSDHMVLQRDMPIHLWGNADVGESIEIQINKLKPHHTKADSSGRWRVALSPMKAGGPHTFTFRGKNTVTLKDVLVGEVWLCSGQSNMEWTVQRSANQKQEIAAANHPNIRHIKIPRRTSAHPHESVNATWQVCSPQTVAQFTAVGYYFARHLQGELNVPIGLVNASWGGTRVEPWTPPIGFVNEPKLRTIHQQVQQMAGKMPYREAARKHLDQVNRWIAAAKAAASQGEYPPPQPTTPASLLPIKSPQLPTVLYHGMIHPVVGLSIRGALWYQGEANRREGLLYADKKRALIQGWRKLWKQGDFPFYFVQIAPYKYGNENPQVLAMFWEAQSKVQEIPNTGMAVINDIATTNDIHPPNKQDVGKRLALIALARDYGRTNLVYRGPTFKKLVQEGDALRVVFDHAKGLATRDGKSPSHFEVIGEGTGFHAATATIEGDAVVLRSAKVKRPVAMRFAWHKLAEPNLTNAAGLPASAFRAGDVPKIDHLAQIKEAKAYTLVYDLDLGKLGRTIAYDVDKAASIKGRFDRVAYFLELQDASGVGQYVYVSMDAFTKQARHLGVPAAAAGFEHRQKVANLTVVSNVSGVKSGTNMSGGNLEFWPNNYGTHNEGKVPNASNQLYDFGDQPTSPRDGYGSMQVHNHQAKQTIFAINRWAAGGGGADIGIGNSVGQTRDWTFKGNAGSYTAKRLRVFVRLAK